MHTVTTVSSTAFRGTMGIGHQKSRQVLSSSVEAQFGDGAGCVLCAPRDSCLLFWSAGAVCRSLMARRQKAPPKHRLLQLSIRPFHLEPLHLLRLSMTPRWRMLQLTAMQAVLQSLGAAATAAAAGMAAAVCHWLRVGQWHPAPLDQLSLARLTRGRQGCRCGLPTAALMPWSCRT